MPKSITGSEERFQLQEVQGKVFSVPYVVTETLSGTYTISPLETGGMYFLDTGGASRDVTLPSAALSKGFFIFFVNTGSDGDTIIVKQGSDERAVVQDGNVAVCVCNGTTWECTDDANDGGA